MDRTPSPSFSAMRRLLRASVASLGLFVVSCSGAGDAVHGASVLPGVPNVSYRYYDVSGTTAEEIRASINANRPRDTNDGKPVDAATRWTIEWGWKVDDRGGCDLTQATIPFRAQIELPRLGGEEALAPDVRARWQAFREALLAHEVGHVRYAYEHIADVRRAIRSSTCATAEKAAAAAVRAIAQRDLDYDRATNHGATEIPPFP